MNVLNDLRVRLALWIGGPTVRLWRARNAMAERMSLDDSARVLGFRDYADLDARFRDSGEASNPECGEREAFTRKPLNMRAVVEGLGEGVAVCRPGDVLPWRCGDCKHVRHVETLGVVPRCSRCGRQMEPGWITPATPAAPGSDATDERGRFISGGGYGGERK